MKDKFLYLALGDDTKKNIAPSLRMAAMKKGFEEILPEKNLILINGREGERAKQILRLIRDKRLKNVKAVYIESSSIGLFFWDIILIAKLKFQKAKVAVFIRDFYPLYKAGWKNTNWKGKVFNLLWFFNIFIYKLYADISYFPSKSSQKILKFQHKDSLPPGLFLDIPNRVMKKNTVFYAGGLGGPYNLIPVLKAVEKLNQEVKVSFNLYCRKNELHLISNWLNKEWLKVEHKSLYELDYKPHVSIISSDNKYLAIARSVKMLDYIKLGSPILISDAYENSKFLREHKIGLIAEPGNAESFYKNLKLIFSDAKLSAELEKNVMNLQKSPELSWNARCKKVLDDLSIKYNYQK